MWNEAITADLTPRELVVLAEDYDRMVVWYVEVLGFRILKQFSDGYQYTNLETESGVRVGIALASEVGVTPGDRSRNTVLLQVGVSDVRDLFKKLEEAGATVLFGPSFDEGGQFWYGGFADIEGNPIWVVDDSCP